MVILRDTGVLMSDMYPTCRSCQRTITIMAGICRAAVALVLRLIVLWLAVLPSTTRAACADYEHCRVEYLGSCDLIDPASNLAFAGGYAYFGTEWGRLVIVDYRNPLVPAVVGRAALGPHEIYGVAVAWPRAYATGANGLQVVSVQDPSSPVLMSQVASGGGRRVAVAGSVAYVASESMGLHIYDVASSTPVRKSTVATTAFDVAIVGQRAYVAAGAEGLLIVDVSDSGHPVVLGRCATPVGAVDVDVEGDLACVAIGSGGLATVDISSPQHPTVIATTPTLGSATSIKVKDGFAYVSEWGLGLTIVDVSDPTIPWVCGGLNLWNSDEDLYHAGEVAVDGGLVYEADRWIGPNVFRVTFHDVPRVLGSETGALQAQAVAVYRDIAYVGDGTAGLRLIDLTAPRRPQMIGTIDTPGSVRGVALHGSLACLADDVRGLQIVDVGDPRAPIARGRLDLPGVAWGVTARTGIGYVAAGGSGLHIVDFHDPDNPALLGSADVYGYALDVAVAGNWALVAAYNDGVSLVNIATPSAPQVVQTLHTVGHAWSVEFSGRYAFVAEGEAGLLVLRLGQGSLSEQSYPLRLPGYATGISLQGNKAFVACQDAGVCVVDIADPAWPEVIGLVATSGSVNAVAVGDLHVCAAGLGDGLHVMAADCPVVAAVGESPVAAAGLQVEVGPNPATVRTNFAFTLGTAGPVRATIYDLAGRRLRELDSGLREVGRQSLPWDGRDAAGRAVAAGVYQVVIESPDGVGRGRVVWLH